MLGVITAVLTAAQAAEPATEPAPEPEAVTVEPAVAATPDTAAVASGADGADASGGMQIDLDTVLRWTEQYGIEVLKVLLILIVAWFVAGWAGGVLTRGLRKAKVEETLTLFFGKLARWGIMIMAILACLQRFGINTTSFAAVIAAAGFAAGLAFQGTLANFSSGVMLLIFRPYKVNDYVEIGGQEGYVREIDLFTTEVDTRDNRRIVIPNSKIFGEIILNYTHNPERRVDVDVGVHYKEDIDRTRQVLFDAAMETTGRLPNRDPEIVLVSLGASSVDWQVRVWCKPKDYWQVRENALVVSKKALDAAGLVIPFPQLDVHLDRLGDA